VTGVQTCALPISRAVAGVIAPIRPADQIFVDERPDSPDRGLPRETCKFADFRVSYRFRFLVSPERFAGDQRQNFELGATEVPHVNVADCFRRQVHFERCPFSCQEAILLPAAETMAEDSVFRPRARKAHLQKDWTLVLLTAALLQRGILSLADRNRILAQLVPLPDPVLARLRATFHVTCSCRW